MFRYQTVLHCFNIKLELSDEMSDIQFDIGGDTQVIDILEDNSVYMHDGPLTCDQLQVRPKVTDYWLVI